ncbi:hypothetical protein [Methanoregula sp.]|jgi:hypothetical protein|uniref:hypothetical protein n=1 Tax=Methanoregula sp. TaxID=2052170 RepID=UPI003C73EC72
MLEMLFGSKTRVKLLTLFCLNPGKDFYIRQISRVTDCNYIGVVNELNNLEEFGLLKSGWRGNQKHYFVDKQCFLFKDLQRLILKTEGLIKTLKAEFSHLEGIDFLFVYGSFLSAKTPAKSEIDLFFVGTIDPNYLLNIVSHDEIKNGRTINFTVYTKEDLLARRKNQDAGIMNIMKEPKIMLIGDYDDFERLGK